MEKENIIIRILSGNANSTDREIFERWLNENEKNKVEFQKIKNIWDTTHPVFDPDHINIHKAEEQFFNRIGKKQKKNKRTLFVSLFNKAAAILFIPLLIVSIYLYIQDNKNKQITKIKSAYQTITIPFGMTSSIELTDGSIVWLNAGTIFKYPVQFKDNVREVELIQGEAFFEVNADTKHPFIVQASNINVTATGTRFNVNAYQNDNIYVSLDKGKVSISNTQGTDEIVMVPGEILSYNKINHTHSVKQGNVYNNYAWINGTTIFRDATLKEVFTRLEQKYNVKFIVKDHEINNYPYHATFENESLSEILNVLEEGNSIKCEDISKQHHEIKGKKIYEVSIAQK